MFLGGGACVEREFNGAQHGLFVVMQYQRQDLDHLPVAARAFEQDSLQTTKPIR